MAPQHTPGPRVYMIDDHALAPPRRHLPQGYVIRGMRSADDLAAWIEIWREAHPALAPDEARFRRAFGHDEALIEERCLLLADERGQALGVAAAWFDSDFLGAPSGRVHWMAVRPSHQGRGLGSALLSEVQQRLRRAHSRSYLATQPDRIDAIQLYRRHGFAPLIVTEEDAEHWEKIGRDEAASGRR